ncbi:MAG: ketoacyl-ACP synthase III [Candidatus Marinimicrobia bacterium]|nr:ketoacyl-ACP synthase III [Candidatus Neomarinimicrobiota bacterium]
MNKRRAKITALGKFIPEKILTNAELEKMVDTSDEWIKTRTGIEKRHILEDDKATSDMIAYAFENMKKNFKINPEEIELIIVATITPDMFFPSTAALTQNKIGATNAWGFDISAACSGFLYAMEIARQFIENGTHKKILVAAAETLSRITDYQDRNTCVLFGDGAAVVLVEPTENNEDTGVIDSILKMDGNGKDYLHILAGGSKHPASNETIKKRMHYIYQDGKTVFKFAVSRMADVSQEILERNSLSGEDIALFIPHQANKRIIDACANKLKLKKEQVLINIHEYANTSAATIPIGLVDAFEQGRLKKGNLVLLSAFGGGFTWGSMLLKWGI